MKPIRAIAIKTKISNLLKGTYVVKEGWDPNHIEVNGKEISRVNIIGTIVGKEEGMFLIDDGNGTIPLRSFEEELSLDVGKIYLLIGKIREYNEQRYIIPEIIKEIEQRWMELRKKELESEKEDIVIEEKISEDNKKIIEEVEKPVEEKKKVVDLEENNEEKEEVKVYEEKKKEEKPLIDLIQELDSGEGVSVEAINEKMGRNCDKELNRLVEEGELFSIKPGVLKVL